MLGLLFPRCPLDTADKAWVERRMLWLAGRFGIDRLRNARVILPTEEFFPADYAPTEDGARRCLDNLCECLGVNPFAVRLQVVADDDMPGAAGLYEQRRHSVIWVARSQLDAPEQLVATLAHELAHELLLKGGHLTTGEWDHELVTDLLPVFLGAGVLLANATVVSQSVSYGNVGYWTIGKQGYLSSVTLGYALALFAFLRGERRPAWRKHLRWDARSTVQTGLRFLHRTGESLFRPDTAEAKPEPPAAPTVLSRLNHPSATERLAALWDIGEHRLETPELLDAVSSRLDDRDRDVRRAATAALGHFGPAAAGFAPRLLHLFHWGAVPIRAAAAEALGRIGGADAATVAGLRDALTDAEADVACAAADALRRLGRAARESAPHLLEVIERAASLKQIDRLDAFTRALRAVAVDALVLIRQHFAGKDPEVRRAALQSFNDSSPGRFRHVPAENEPPECPTRPPAVS